MAKEKDTNVVDELYGGDPEVVKELFKSVENRREFVKKVVKPAEDAAKELEDATATEEVRLQGTEEPKPVLKPFTESIDVKDRKELGTLIKEAKEEGRKWKIERSKKEGFRYTFSSIRMVEEAEEKPADGLVFIEVENLSVLKELKYELGMRGIDFQEAKGGIKVAKGEPENTAKYILNTEFKGRVFDRELFYEAKEEDNVEDMLEPSETKIVTDKIASEADAPAEEENKEITMGEIFTKYFDIHGNEDHSISLCLKGKMDDEDCVCITTEPLNDEEYEILKAEFHDEEESDPVNDPADEPEEVEVIADAELSIDDVVGDEEEIIDEAMEDKNMVFIKTSNRSISTAELIDELDIQCIPYKEGNEGVYVDKIYADEVEDIINQYEEEELDESKLAEASSAEKKAIRDDNADNYADLVIGRAIARIKDPAAREAAVAAMKAGRPDAAHNFTGDRKEQQADAALQKKLQKIVDASPAEYKDESLNESILVEEDAVVADNVDIRLDDLQYFKPVAGARDTWDAIVKANKVAELAKVLSDFTKDGKMNTTQLNDTLWFEKEWVLDKLNINPADLAINKEDAIDADFTVEEK